jgi:TRAP-type C4-dicarboxylate transport system permease small subunit
MENLIDIENRKFSKKKNYFRLFFTALIIYLNITDIVEDKYGDFVYYYIVVLTILILISLAIYLFNLTNRNYSNFTLSILGTLWLISAPFKYSHNHEHSGFMYYFQLIGGGLFFMALLFELVNYKKFINRKPFME